MCEIVIFSVRKYDENTGNLLKGKKEQRDTNIS